MSIPLVQKAEKDDINTSIIAIKRNIERINMLLGLSNSEDIDTSEFVKKSDIVDEVTLGNMQSVTSNAVFKACSPNYAQKQLIYNGISLYNQDYIAPDNGFIMGRGYGSGQTTSYLYFEINGVTVGNQGVSDETIGALIPVRKGDTVIITAYLANRNHGIYFVPCN
jgi:hypothetical protein